MKNVWSFFCGVIFALGLGISGMMSPEKVISFLNVSGSWDPSLAFVMIGAIGVYIISYPLILKMRKKPLLEDDFHIVKANHIDKKLIIGEALFGIGWGLTGICPGPGVANLITLAPNVLIFVGFMGMGMAFYKAYEMRQKVCM